MPSCVSCFHRKLGILSVLLVTAAHRDTANVQGSSNLSVSLGDFTGGQLWLAASGGAGFCPQIRSCTAAQNPWHTLVYKRKPNVFPRSYLAYDRAFCGRQMGSHSIYNARMSSRAFGTSWLSASVTLGPGCCIGNIASMFRTPCCCSGHIVSKFTGPGVGLGSCFQSSLGFQGSTGVRLRRSGLGTIPWRFPLRSLNPCRPGL